MRDGLGILKNATVVSGLESIIKCAIKRMVVVLVNECGIGI